MSSDLVDSPILIIVWMVTVWNNIQIHKSSCDRQVTYKIKWILYCPFCRFNFSNHSTDIGLILIPHHNINSYNLYFIRINMSTAARRRLMRDFRRLQEDPPMGVSGAPGENNIMIWNAVIFGTQNTYETKYICCIQISF